MFDSGKVWCTPSSPWSRRSGRCAWLRVAVLLPFPAFCAMADALSGRDAWAAKNAVSVTRVAARNP
jgi:hypothetical protein